MEKTNQLFKKIYTIKRIVIAFGFGIICIGYYMHRFIYNSSEFLNIFSYVIIGIGSQAVLWGLGVQSDLLGNKLDETEKDEEYIDYEEIEKNKTNKYLDNENYDYYLQDLGNQISFAENQALLKIENKESLNELIEEKKKFTKITNREEFSRMLFFLNEEIEKKLIELYQTEFKDLMNTPASPSNVAMELTNKGVIIKEIEKSFNLFNQIIVEFDRIYSPQNIKDEYRLLDLAYRLKYLLSFPSKKRVNNG